MEKDAAARGAGTKVTVVVVELVVLRWLVECIFVVVVNNQC